MARLVDALPAIRSSRFDLPLTYAVGDLSLALGDAVAVPLGKREVVAYVVRAPYEGPQRPGLRAVRARFDVPRAFDETGLSLARFIATNYICTLGEALGAVVRGEALPRMADLLVRVQAQPRADRYRSVPAALLALIWNEMEPSFTLEGLLRHPGARRIGDRAMLLRCIGALVRGGDLRRERRTMRPRAHAYRVRVLSLGTSAPRGPKARALVQEIARRGEIAYGQALLAGFSGSVVSRAIESGALVERYEAPVRETASGAAALPTPTQEQHAAISRIEEALASRRFAQMLLHGVTGSGKTLVYLRAIERVVERGGRAIVLVPEISLTPQTAARFEAVFAGRVAVLHSALGQSERLDAWQACSRGEIDVVVGARSAVFVPLRDVALIVVDEAHESTYKQDSQPRYSAVAVARERARMENGVLLLGSATPSLESFAAARAGRIEYLRLRERPSGAALPAVEIVDLAAEFREGRNAIFSTALERAVAERLARNEKSVLFLNRRGSARFALCRACGSVPQCRRCSVSLAVHRGENLLRCHYCDHEEAIPRRCPRCGKDAIGEYGPGTERVAAEVTRLFAQARVVRMDSDTTAGVGAHARLLREFEESADVLVGTQMVAKGLDFAGVTLAGVVAADVGLHAPDFRAAERTFSLIMQVCGRSGRSAPGGAIVQTYSPTHPAIAYAARHDYDGFAAQELRERQAAGYPPFSRLVYLGVVGRVRSDVVDAATRYAQRLKRTQGADVLGPAPYPVARVNGEWRYRIAIRSRKPAAVRRAIRQEVLPLAAAERHTRLAINVDP
ncbi:MAG: replication restart helicase PriA [Candidatus Tyrphobacter sp.]